MEIEQKVGYEDIPKGRISIETYALGAVGCLGSIGLGAYLLVDGINQQNGPKAVIGGLAALYGLRITFLSIKETMNFYKIIKTEPNRNSNLT